METAKLSSKHQITVPKRIRLQLGVDTGDILNFRSLEDGRVMVETSAQIQKSDGAAKRRLSSPSAVFINEDDAVLQWVQQEDQRTRTLS